MKIKTSKNEYMISRISKLTGKIIPLYVLGESADALLEHKAIETLKARGYNDEEAREYLESLDYVPTRGGWLKP